MSEGYSHAQERRGISPWLRANVCVSAWIGSAVEVVRGVDRAFDALLRPVKHLLAGVQPDVVGVQLVLFVEVRREAESVTEGAVHDAVGPAVCGFQVITVQVVSRARHPAADTSSSAPP